MTNVLLSGVVVLFLRQEECDTGSVATRQDGGLVDIAVTLGEQTNKCVATLVVSSVNLVLERNCASLLLRSHSDLVLCPLEIVQRNEFGLELGGADSSRVGKILEFSARESGRTASDGGQIDLW